MGLTLLEQITNAVRQRVHPFRVEAQTAEHGQLIGVKVEGFNKWFGYRAILKDGTPNRHTPETFADDVARRAIREISAILAADEKRDRKAAKRVPT